MSKLSYLGERSESRLLSRASRACTFHDIPQMESLLAGYRLFGFRNTKRNLYSHGTYLNRRMEMCTAKCLLLWNQFVQKCGQNHFPRMRKSPLPVDVRRPKRHRFVVCVYPWVWFYILLSMLGRGFQFYFQSELVRLFCSQ